LSELPNGSLHSTLLDEKVMGVINAATISTTIPFLVRVARRSKIGRKRVAQDIEFLDYLETQFSDCCLLVKTDPRRFLAHVGHKKPHCDLLANLLVLPQSMGTEEPKPWRRHLSDPERASRGLPVVNETEDREYWPNGALISRIGDLIKMCNPVDNDALVRSQGEPTF